MLGSEIEVCKSLRRGLKIVNVIKMTFLYDARYSVVLLRPKNEVKLLPQSAEKSICMGKLAVPNWAEFFHHVVVVGLEPELADRTRLLPNCSADVVL